MYYTLLLAHMKFILLCVVVPFVHAVAKFELNKGKNPITNKDELLSTGTV